MKKIVLSYIIALGIHSFVYSVTHIVVTNETDELFKITIKASDSLQFHYEQDAHIIKSFQRKQVLWLDEEALSSQVQQEHEYVIRMRTTEENVICKHKVCKVQGTLQTAYCVADNNTGDHWYTDCRQHCVKKANNDSIITITHQKIVHGNETTIEYIIKKIPTHFSEPTLPEQLHVLTWNVDMKPMNLVKNGQYQRALRIPEYVYGNDVVVLTELFDQKSLAIVQQKLMQEYPYTTIQKSWKEKQPGVYIFSKWPVISQDYIGFSKMCTGFDCNVEKGIAYACIEKMGQRYHLFGAMLQDWPSNKSALVRHEQLKKIRTVLDEYELNKEEPVIIAGSFYINKYKSSFDDKKRSELQEMINILQADLGEHKGYPFTVDPSINSLARIIDPKEYSDYIICLSNHKKPKTFIHEVCIFKSPTCWHEHFKSPQRDLSSHFAISAQLEF